MMAHGSFATAINCMDGRVQEPVSQWLKTQFDVDYVDMITEPGPDRLLAEGPEEIVESIHRRAEISVKAHNSSLIAVVSHFDCAGNPVSEETHLKHLNDAVNVVMSWQLPVRVLGLWVNQRWEAELIYDTEAQ